MRLVKTTSRKVARAAFKGVHCLVLAIALTAVFVYIREWLEASNDFTHSSDESLELIEGDSEMQRTYRERMCDHVSSNLHRPAEKWMGDKRMFHRLKGVALALKTGEAVGDARVTVQDATWLPSFPMENVLFIGDSEFSANCHEVHNVLKKIKAAGGGFDADEEAGIANVSTIEDTRGWTNDAHKNIPGFKMLFDKYPDKKWYFMVDDDTYVFTDQLAEFVAKRDHNKEIFYGRSMVWPRQHKPTVVFAHGGSGILLSRAAMLKLIEIADTKQCRLNRYVRECPFGDARVSMCLQNANVTFKTYKYFNSVPLHPKDLDSTERGCDPSITFHKMNEEQMTQLHTSRQEAAEAGIECNMGYLYQQYYRWHPEYSRNHSLTAFSKQSSRAVGQIATRQYSDSEFKCSRKCDVNEECAAWNYRQQDKECVLLKVLENEGFVSDKRYSTGIPVVCINQRYELDQAT